ncbi:TadE/TadG family type IV pilus assembly protein [Streptomyces sp. DSM 44917]|uniref:TadE/TadG family type IV pilus assembly protein n=1 Tax=Streptomyces boetiae TaxID=3075541 RepID=A0ABU2L6R8_9ACTN|nr:TadE/TadG family type IV pilus assembly protein [Streptomyces sp. DSM 44917]MDT0307266.1 TadE/TadG family type IV pilus assembly protein [Streptomyces sp. DSM 44917]
MRGPRAATRRERAPRTQRRSRSGDRGSASAELVLLLPVLILVLYVVVYAERGSDARMRLDDAAHQAARAASQARTPGQAADAARATADAALAEAGIACQTITVQLDGTLEPGSTVTATLTCTVGLQDLAMIPLPGTTTLDANFTAPVDLYRGSTLTPAATGGERP